LFKKKEEKYYGEYSEKLFCGLESESGLSGVKRGQNAGAVRE